VKTSFIHVLAPCLLLAACVPLGPPSAGYPSVPRTGSMPVSKQKPQVPVLKRLENGHYRVRKPWTVELHGRLWQVQKGYTSNGITAPANLRNSLGDGVDHPETWAAVFHDWLFTQPGISRAQADKMFYDLLLAYGVPAQKAKMMHTTVAAYSLSKAFR
jgi:Protein of unknown function (DUF1353)